MCGIAGLAGVPHASGGTRTRAMLDQLLHRGPDAEGLAAGPGWTIGVRRLAIIDLVSGDQPVMSEDGRVQAVLNGEIYNYRELRQELVGRGHELRSQGDSEVLVHLWEDLGPAMLARLRGMFALALIDEGKRCLFLARDRVGKKPLYWARPEGGLVFASELKALRAGLPQRPAVAPGALRAFLQWGFVPERQCIAQGVQKLPPGSWLQLDLGTGEIRQQRYWDLRLEPRPELTTEEAAEQLRAALDEAVRLRLRADVPLAVFLSGGLDSGVVTALAARHQADLRALCVEMAGTPSEAGLARATAEKVDVRLEVVRVGAEASVSLLDSLATVFDEPLADPSCLPTLLVAQAVRGYATVVLNGDGGDEVLAGYRRHLAAHLRDRPAARLAAYAGAAVASHLPLRRQRRDWAHRLSAGLAPGADPYMEWGAVKLSPAEVGALLGEEPAPSYPVALGFEAAGGDTFGAVRALDLGFFLPGDLLPKMDRATMAVSLEARSPLLDHEVLELCATFPVEALLAGRRTKAVLRALAVGLLPEEVCEAPKRGFEPPLAAWLAGGWAGEVATVLEDPEAAISTIAPVERRKAWRNWQRRPDRERAARAVYTLVTLEHWLRRWAS